MKVVSVPSSIPFDDPNYRNYDHELETRRVEEHMDALRLWLSDNGYRGDGTGKVVSFVVGIGYARYMFADSDHESFLIHLPYGDGFHFGRAGHLRREDILQKIELDDRRRADLESRRLLHS